MVRVYDKLSILKIQAKRTNFSAIQASHAVSCSGYHQSTCRTGYDSVIADRTHDLFALTAKQKGIVKSINEYGIIIEYEDKTIQGYELGRRFGAAAGLTIPHNVITSLKAGDVFDIGDVIVYNDGFFEPDFFNPKKITLKNSINVRTVLWESYQTLEDASSVSNRVSSRLSTNVTKVKNIIVAFDQSISKLVKVGDKVDSDSFLCIIEDAITANNNLFTSDSIDTLRMISAQTPRASVKGIVEKIEVFYHGDKKDMTDSLRNLVNSTDRNLKAKQESLGIPVMTGSVDSGLRIDNEPLGLDNLVIKIYITHGFESNQGDKGVFGNQMKTVFSEVIENDYVTEDGEIIDCIFGAQSINDRIVMSPYIIGTTNVLLDVIAKKAIALYDE